MATKHGDKLTRDRQRAWVTQVMAAKVVARIARSLAPVGQVIPVKGVLMGRRFYDDPSERPLSDCDLVVVHVSAQEAAAALARDGWRVAAWSNDANVVDLVHPELPGIGADLHARPLPVGYGAVTSRWLAHGAREDTDMFGAPVLIPHDARLLVHLLGNILRDHVVNAREHTPEDVARVLARSPCELTEFAAAIRDARLRIGCWSALGWVGQRVQQSRVEELRELLALTRAERTFAQWRDGVIRGASARTGASLTARALARCISDSPVDVMAGIGAALYGVARARMLRRR